MAQFQWILNEKKVFIMYYKDNSLLRKKMIFDKAKSWDCRIVRMLTFSIYLRFFTSLQLSARSFQYGYIKSLNHFTDRHQSPPSYFVCILCLSCMGYNMSTAIKKRIYPLPNHYLLEKENIYIYLVTYSHCLSAI